ncbi:MAG: hypothetical protein LBQ54_05790 [Planctomycetaceae bacterium]|nr:hypothetical protein [Planctomycetaceae bacterium]
MENKIESEISLTGESSFEIGETKISVRKMPSDDFMNFATNIAKTKFAFFSETPFDNIKEMILLNEKGEPITFCEGEKTTVTQGDKNIYSQDYYLAEAIDTFKLQMVYDGTVSPAASPQTSSMVIPVLLEFGAGL